MTAEHTRHRPRLESYWDPKRQAVAYKVSITHTSKYLLFTEDTLRDLQSQIGEALKGTSVDRVRT
jgi:hypothetical protein